MNDPISQNIIGVQSLVGSKLNKIQTTAANTPEGVESEPRDEFTLDLTDEELLHLKRQWETNYAGYEAKIKIRQEANKTYYLGRQKEGSQWATTDGQPIGSNLLFEAEETFLPAALSKNPEPVVWSDNTEEGTKLADSAKTMLQYHADTLVLRRKLTRMTRHWSIYFIGIAKHGWNSEIKEITTDIRDPRNFIFDVDGFIDDYGDYEGPLGERITVTAQKLIDLFPKHKAYITIMVDGKLGTKVTYTEWWNDNYCFYSFKDKILEKNKNPHFNYAKKKKSIDIDGNIIEEEVKGNNHFAMPKKPYTFLSVFSLGEQPHDVTGLIEQNIPNQRRISRRTEQIDYNLSRQNNSDIFSENNFTQETAKQAATAIIKGHPVLIPSGGPIGEAIHRLPAQGLDGAFFKGLDTDKADLRSIFGVDGLGVTPPEKQKTLGGLINNEQHDNTRIGGGIGDALEQVADNVFNWWVQLYCVYYDVEHYAMVMGKARAVEYTTLQSSGINKRLVISVTPNSMKPRDEVSEMNQALQLYEAQALDPKTLLTRLNFPDPQKTAEQTCLWLVDQNSYIQLNFPEVAQQLQQAQAMAQQQMMQMQQQEMAMQQQQQGQQMEQQAGQANQQMNIKEAQTQQAIQHKEATHQQKLKQNEEAHKSKIQLSKVNSNLSKANKTTK